MAKAKMGRPKIEIDLESLEKLVQLSPSLDEAANFFDCSPDTIESVIKKTYQCTFAEFRDKKGVHTRMGIKRKMIEKALAGDNTMLIWLSKNMLGMSDKMETKTQHSGLELLTDEQLDERLKALRAKEAK